MASPSLSLDVSDAVALAVAVSSGTSMSRETTSECRGGGERVGEGVEEEV